MDQEKIGKFITSKRKEKNLTQSELAEKLGVTDRAVSNWENGKNMPDLSLFKPLCEILNISINELMSGEKLNDLEYNKKLEEYIITTIDYIDKKNTKSNDIKNIIYLTIGVITLILSNIIFNKELETSLRLISLMLIIYGVKHLSIKYKVVRRILATILLSLCIISLLLVNK